jgi:L-lactate dehydrogenase complex protein LldE
MIRHHYPRLFAGDGTWEARAGALAAKTHELTSFLVDVLGIEGVDAEFEATVTYHDSCSGLRELSIKAQPRKLLADVRGLTLTEAEEAETCCGFGGTFCIKYPDISGRMVDKKAEDMLATGAGTVLAGDMGCLLNIAGRLKRRGKAMKVRHVAEVLAGMADGPAIGEPPGDGT